MEAFNGFDLFAKARPTSSTRLVHALAIFGGTLDASVNASARKGAGKWQICPASEGHTLAQAGRSPLHLVREARLRWGQQPSDRGGNAGKGAAMGTGKQQPDDRYPGSRCQARVGAFGDRAREQEKRG